jgi:hypothetical protein
LKKYFITFGNGQFTKQRDRVALEAMETKGYDTNLYFHKTCWKKELEINGEWKSNVNV